MSGEEVTPAFISRTTLHDAKEKGEGNNLSPNDKGLPEEKKSSGVPQRPMGRGTEAAHHLVWRADSINNSYGNRKSQERK